MPVANPILSQKLNALTLHSPAKINLMLSVHGRREDGFHELTSVVVALAFGDTLRVRPCRGGDRLLCSDSALPVGPENLILRAAEAFRAATGEAATFSFELEKRIPVGAGLGGGSGNAAVALKAMNQLCGEPLNDDGLRQVAAELGSDCSFFIGQSPAVMSGRGEHIEPLSDALVAQLAGKPLLLFKPDFAVETQWAYGQLVQAAPRDYEPRSNAESRLAAYTPGAAVADLLFNSFQAAIGRKFIAIASLLDELKALGVPCLMSGSGSCCFAFERPSGPDFGEIERLVRSAWGESVFFVETSILAGETNAVCGGL